MANEAGHVQITEFNKEAIPMVNWMMEDLFCQYGVSIPWFMLDFDFPDYSQRPDWITYSPPEWYLPEWRMYWPTWPSQWPDWLLTNGFSFGSDWGKWGYWLTWFNELLGLLFDGANLPRLSLSDLSETSVSRFNDYMDMLYAGVLDLVIYDTVGTFTEGETVIGEDSEVTGVIKKITADSLKLTNLSGTFADEEKITGQTSGAYAWTVDWTRQNIFGLVGTFLVDETIEGETSGATAIIRAVADDYLMLSDVVGNFADDEKVTGGDSGAYAYTAEQPAEEEFSVTDEDPNVVRRYGLHADGSAEAWDEYDNNPSYETDHIAYCNLICTYIGVYKALGNKFYFKFNTSGASENPQTATVTFTCKARNNTGLDNPTLRLYSQDYGDEVGTDDWGGGVLAASYLLDVGGVMESVDVEMSISTDYVNVGGWSKFKLNLKELDDNTHPTKATGFACQDITSIKLTLSY